MSCNAIFCILYIAFPFLVDQFDSIRVSHRKPQKVSVRIAQFNARASCIAREARLEYVSKLSFFYSTDWHRDKWRNQRMEVDFVRLLLSRFYREVKSLKTDWDTFRRFASRRETECRSWIYSVCHSTNSSFPQICFALVCFRNNNNRAFLAFYITKRSRNDSRVKKKREREEKRFVVSPYVFFVIDHALTSTANSSMDYVSLLNDGIIRELPVYRCSHEGNSIKSIAIVASRRSDSRIWKFGCSFGRSIVTSTWVRAVSRVNWRLRKAIDATGSNSRRELTATILASALRRPRSGRPSE